MAESFFGALNPLLMLFSCILIGFILNKLKLFSNDASAVLSKCEKYVFMPALGYAVFSKYCTVATLKENINVFLYSFIAIVIALAISLPLSAVFEKNDINKRNIYKYSLTFANHGFMGNAIVPLVMGGQEHLYMYLLFALPLNFLTYSWGITILTPKEMRSKNPLLSLVNAPLIGMLVGMVVGLLNIQRFVPSFIVTTAESLQACMGPVAMVLTGFIIGNYSFKSLLSQKKVYVATFLRLIVIPLIIVTALTVLGADKYVVTLAVFAFATPLGLNTVVMPAVYGGDTKTGAGMALVSHVLCVITIPLMYGLVNLL